MGKGSHAEDAASVATGCQAMAIWRKAPERPDVGAGAAAHEGS